MVLPTVLWDPRAPQKVEEPMVVQDCACAAPASSTATPAAPRRRRNGVMLSPSVVGAASSGIANSYAAAPARGFTLKMGAGGGHCQGGRPARRPLRMAAFIRPLSESTKERGSGKERGRAVNS